MGRAQGHDAAARRRTLRQDRPHQGGAGARLQSAADLRARHRRRLRVLHPEPRRRRLEADERGRRSSSCGELGPRAGQAQTLCAPTCRSSTSTSTARSEEGGGPINDVFAALSATLGNYYVNDFNKYGRAWQVLMSAETVVPLEPDDIGAVYVRSDKGEMIPLGVARQASSIRRDPIRSIVQQPAGGEDLRQRLAGRQLRGRPSPGSSGSRTKCCGGLQL